MLTDEEKNVLRNIVYRSELIPALSTLSIALVDRFQHVEVEDPAHEFYRPIHETLEKIIGESWNVEAKFRPKR